VASASAYQEARTWISDCFLSHAECRGGQEPGPPNLPTRVIDVLGDCSPSKVRLHAAHGEKAKYATLSYCWGKMKQVMTTRETLATFTNGIEVGTLPKTLRDAISSTQQLQIPYLWIDSLCIIQDDQDDMTREISRMPQIYKNAVVTISAAIAQDCGEGFLKTDSK
jgi:hypothetical protein